MDGYLQGWSEDRLPVYARPSQVVEMEIWSTNGPGDEVHLRSDDWGIEDMTVPLSDVESQLPDDWALGAKVKVRFA